MSVRRLVSLVLVLGFVIPSAWATSLRELVPAATPHGARVVIAGVAVDSTDVPLAFTAADGGAATAVIVRSSATHVEAVVSSTVVTRSRLRERRWGNNETSFHRRLRSCFREFCCSASS